MIFKPSARSITLCSEITSAYKPIRNSLYCIFAQQPTLRGSLTPFPRRFCTPITATSAIKASNPPSLRINMKPASDAGWTLIGTPSSELRLEFTLPTGQSFRWKPTAPGEFTGVLGRRAVILRQLDDDVAFKVLARAPDALPSEDAAAIADYFNLSVSLGTLAEGWRAADPHFARLSTALPGARMLRQDPVECLFSFICSQNNHISRIHGMVNRLCEQYGTALPTTAAAGAGAKPTPLYAFPTLEQLAKATEEDLREAGFGYRARYIVGAVEELASKSNGGAEWLMALRTVPFADACEALCTLPGVGPKVAACVALFSLDKHEAIPVDVHVWNLATKRYCTQLRGKTNNPKLHPIVQAAFVDLFGPYAGWAHNTLFIGELASMKERVAAVSGSADEEESSAAEESSASDEDSASEEEYVVVKRVKKVEGEDVGAAVAGLLTPAAGGEGRPKRRRAAVKAMRKMKTAAVEVKLE